MRPKNTDDLIAAVVIATILFFLMAAFIISYLIIYRRKKREHQQQLQQAKVEFEKQLLQAQLEIQAQTFSEISREIHDNVGQVLSLAKVQLNIVDEKDSVDKSLLHQAKENISQAMTDLRDIARGLSTDKIERTGFHKAVQSEVEKIQRTGLFTVRFSLEGSVRNIDGQKSLMLFRIIQECIQNIVKHAGARVIDITLNYTDEGLDIYIRDDGKGFELSANGRDGGQTGLGLRNIYKRMSLIGGRIEIDSRLQEGTIINIKVSYE
jgi:two-component system, NarL family, sensor kinase